MNNVLLYIPLLYILENGKPFSKDIAQSYSLSLSSCRQIGDIPEIAKAEMKQATPSIGFVCTNRAHNILQHRPLLRRCSRPGKIKPRYHVAESCSEREFVDGKITKIVCVCECVCVRACACVWVRVRVRVRERERA